jgi:hypothetical protein
LRASDYLAAVNTSCFPEDCAPDDLRLGDLLRPAITRFHGFPIFQRHYPKRGIDSACDLFLGKPALSSIINIPAMGAGSWWNLSGNCMELNLSYRGLHFLRSFPKVA